MNKFFSIIKGDKVIWVVVFLLSIISILSVYSSTGTLAFKRQAGNTEYYLIRHFSILAFGLFLMYITHLIKYTYYSRISQILLFVSVPLLLFTLLKGTNINEANRWITLPIINVTFQSSDLAKLALIIYLARMLAKKQDQIKELKEAFIPIMIPVLIICGLILPANFSTAAILFTICIILMIIGRINSKYILSLVGIGVVLFSITIAVLLNSTTHGRLGTWKNRIERFMGSGKGELSNEGDYQIEQAKIAVANGQIFGKMPGNSSQRNFLPHPYSDFIFAIIVEEYGLIGSIFIIMLYLIILFRAVRIVIKGPGTFGAFLVTGLSFSLVFQAFINMSVAVDLLPVTGQPLPLVSMGGTSIWFTSIAIGIILSVSKEIENEVIEIQEISAEKVVTA
ncbi:MAG: FtsW/RodA/SpoVE family cell cycle protein [Bacteroidota bacterium]